MEIFGESKPVFYFRYKGEVNTARVLELARERALELGIGKMVVPSETGRSALRALEVLKGTSVHLIVVTHPPAATRGPKGDIPIGLSHPAYRKVRDYLVQKGVTVVQGTRPFGGFERWFGWETPVPAAFVDKALELFGPGTKIAIEAAIMATDAGALEEGEEVVTLGGTYKGLDTALVVRTAGSSTLFSRFEVLEIIAKPRYPGIRLPEYEQENWQGDLEQYYRPIELPPM